MTLHTSSVATPGPTGKPRLPLRGHGLRAVAGAATLALGQLVASAAGAQQTGVSGTLHNLSVSGPGDIKSQTETEVCKFCHIPHSAVAPTPLWGHALPAGQQYAVPKIRAGKGLRQPVVQPDGSSRLCLSCHDGTVALGDVGRRRIPMAGAEHLAPGRKGFLGTDLSGGHPISFLVQDSSQATFDSTLDMGVRSVAAISADKNVRLDPQGKMQCTTCHDPHADQHYVAGGRVPHFWVKSTVEEVCLTCHELR